MRSIYWFRNDLRISDNPSLDAALKSSDEILPVYIFEDRYWEEDEWENVKTGPYRTQFLIESVADLSQQLEEVGSQLLVLKGDASQLIADLSAEHGIKHVFAQKEHTFEETEVEKRVAEDLQLHLEEGFTLYHPDDLPIDIQDLPDIFTQFRKLAEKKSKVRHLIPTPDAISTVDFDPEEMPEMADFGFDQVKPDPRGILPFKGGSEAAWDRLDHYFWKTNRLSVYKKTRNGLVGADYSSKFSPWLANGSLSAKEIYYEVLRYEGENGSNQSTYWLIFELLWRDYFRFVSMRYGNRIFWKKGIKESAPRWLQKGKALARWEEARTGDSFVDANMKELIKTGWMSNRGRQNVASYLVHDLGVDWRAGASFFEHYLLDFDPASNYGNWIYVAGVGNDPRPNRKFNTSLQADRYDPNGKFQRRWNDEILEFDI